jgi:hypothetical protein
MRHIPVSIGLLSVLALSACAAVPPTGPSVMALPGQGKSFEAFQQDDSLCRQYATQIIGGESPAVAANNAAIGSAVLGTALGAGVGAALGSLGGAAGTGAAAGAAAGLLAGSAIGAGNTQAATGSLQHRYDTSYAQCMYAKGDSVQAPVYAGYPYRNAPGYVGYAPGWYGGPGWYGPGYGYGYGPSVVIGGGWGWGWGPRWRRHW